jgi:hypothetical protein
MSCAPIIRRTREQLAAANLLAQQRRRTQADRRNEFAASPHARQRFADARVGKYFLPRLRILLARCQ